MHIQEFRQFEQLEPYRARWQQLADERLFCSFDWLATWWQHYGQNSADCQLAVFCVFESPARPACQNEKKCEPLPSADSLIAVLPCYRQQTFARGLMLRLLGDGEVCSEHLGLLVNPEDTVLVAKALAEHFTGNTSAWDVLDFEAIEQSNDGINQLVAELRSLDCQVASKAGQSCWSIELPATWEEFLALQSKSHRKQLRRLDKRVLESNQARFHLVKTAEQFENAWPILIDLHQRRRNSLNEPGCFASRQWADFHRDVAQKLLATDQLRLSWLEYEGTAIAAEYQFANSQTTFAYQGGLDPTRLDCEPGRLSMICSMKQAIEEKHTTFDLLRGDEPYKAHWRATPTPTFDIQVVPPRRAARFRYQANNIFRQAGRVARQVTHLLS